MSGLPPTLSNGRPRRRVTAVVSVACLTVAAALTLAACGASDSDEPIAAEETTSAATTTSSSETGATAGETGAATADSGEASALEGKKLGLVLYSTDAYQLAEARHIEEYAESQGASVQRIDGKIDPEVQANAISDLIAAGVDGILFQPVDPAAAVGPIREAQAADIPLTTFAIKPDEAVTTPFLELNEYETTFQAGVNAANEVKELFPDDPVRVIAIDIPTVPLCSELRVEGFIDGVQSVDPSAEVIARPDGKGDRLTATNVMEDLIQRDPDFNIVMACNGEMLLGVLGALEAAGRGKAENKMPESEYLFSIDGSPAEIEKLVDPSSALMETMILQPQENGRKWLDLLTKVMTGELAPDEDYTEKVGSLLLSPDCAEVAGILEEQYFEGVDCPS